MELGTHAGILLPMSTSSTTIREKLSKRVTQFVLELQSVRSLSIMLVRSSQHLEAAVLEDTQKSEPHPLISLFVNIVEHFS